jgi:ribose transport system ATP-binding protein
MNSDRRISAPSVAVTNVSKVYPGVMALKNVSLEFLRGETHALIGKNGAGKSTLIRILSGSTEPTDGTVSIGGKSVSLSTPRDALENGIATVYQELSLMPNLTVGHNIMLRKLPTKIGGMIVDWRAVYERAADILAELHLDIDVHAPTYTLGVASQQMVEIAKSMVFEPKVLLLDEPTSALSEHEIESLFELIRKLTARGVAVIYISHRMRELQQIAQRVSVLRDGELVGTLGIAEASPSRVADMMFGEVPQKERPADLRAGGEIALQAKGLRHNDKLNGVDLEVRKGEILGIAGLMGSGRTELLRALAGAEPVDAGTISIYGSLVTRTSIRAMNRLGVGFAPENRKEAGLVLGLSTRENICLASLDRVSRYRVVQQSLEKSVVDRYVHDLRIKVPNVELPVGTLSGGNQQKVVIAKWLNTDLKIMLLDEPTRGVDIRAKQQIFEVMWDLSRRGASSVFVSSELEELVEVCHRIAIMHAGQIVGYVNAEDVTPQQLFGYCVEYSPS